MPNVSQVEILNEYRINFHAQCHYLIDGVHYMVWCYDDDRARLWAKDVKSIFPLTFAYIVRITRVKEIHNAR